MKANWFCTSPMASTSLTILLLGLRLGREKNFHVPPTHSVWFLPMHLFYSCQPTTGGTCPGNWFHYSFPCSYGVLYRKPRHLSIESVNPVSQSSGEEGPPRNECKSMGLSGDLPHLLGHYQKLVSCTALPGPPVWSSGLVVLFLYYCRLGRQIPCNLMNYSTALYSLIKLVRGSVVGGGRWVCSWWGWGSELAY